MPKVTLIHYTGKDTQDEVYAAARLMVFTKQTRLQMSPGAYDRVKSMPKKKLLKELEYMSTTIPSSWEFVDLVFMIENLSRATAQQVTRTRQASYAMQSQRVTDMSEVSWDIPENLDPSLHDSFEFSMKSAVDDYKALVENGASLEDARDVLPVGVHCNLVAKYNFRTFVDLVSKRESIRVQGPYREIVSQMKEEVLRVWPWAKLFLRNPNEVALKMIEEVASELSEGGAVYKGHSGKLAKAIDLLKK